MELLHLSQAGCQTHNDIGGKIIPWSFIIFFFVSTLYLNFILDFCNLFKKGFKSPVKYKKM
jgi:hypothetical protein